MQVHLLGVPETAILQINPVRGRERLPPTYVLARDHLQRAATILQGADQRSRQLRHIIERTIGLMDEVRPETSEPANNVVELNDYRPLQQ